MENSLKQLLQLGHSIWYDNISREAIQSGELLKLSDDGITGVTSNPTIFEKAISGSTLYDDSIKLYKSQNLSPFEILENLMIEDIKAACDIFYPIYKISNGNDGFVSIEVDPTLAKETEATIQAAKKLWDKIQKPNLMIKIPATKEGLKAVEETIYNGINVNVTLIFSIERYVDVAKAYIKGLRRRIDERKDVKDIRSVASVFVSRIDSKVDKILEEKIKAGQNDLSELLGRAAIWNTKLLYHEFAKIFYTKEFNDLEKQGAKLQRPLWASTSTKNPKYKPTLYVDDLVAKDTVNTLPPNTIKFVLQNQYTETLIQKNLDDSINGMKKLKSIGIDISSILYDLEVEGVSSFSTSFNSLLKLIEQK